MKQRPGRELDVPDTLESSVCGQLRTLGGSTWVCDKDPHLERPEQHYFIGVSR